MIINSNVKFKDQVASWAPAEIFARGGKTGLRLNFFSKSSKNAKEEIKNKGIFHPGFLKAKFENLQKMSQQNHIQTKSVIYTVMNVFHLKSF